MPKKQWKIAIRKQADRWIVEKPRGKPLRGIDEVEWTLVAGAGEDISAHIQLPEMELFANLPGRSDLSKDMTAALTAKKKTLKLKVHPRAKCRDGEDLHRYAVWIWDRKHPEKSTYAVGEDLNPPPEITVGP